MLLYLTLHTLLLTSSPSLQVQARQALLQQLPEGTEVKIKSIKLQGAALPLNQLCEVEALAQAERGQARLRLQYKNAQGQRSTRWALAKIEICGPVWLARKRLPPGATIQPGDLQQQKRCVHDAVHLANSEKSPFGSRLRRQLRRGELLNQAWLRPAPMLQRGQHLRLYWRRGGIEIHSEAEALDDAMQGQSLRLRRVGGRKILRAKAVAPGIAELQP